MSIEFQLEDNKLIYKKEEYQPAQDWEKSFEDGKYAYQNTVSGPDPLYFGARYMEKTTDEEVIKASDYMVDLTILNPGKVGSEFVKTVGHFHGIIPGKDYSYPEVYEAVSGKFEYLLQKVCGDEGVEVLWVIAEPGDKIMMPPNFGHVSMNIGFEQAVEVDVQKRDNPNFSDYSIFKEKTGGAYYRTEDGLKKNPNYKIKSIKIVRPNEIPEWGLTKNKSLYDSLVDSPEKFKYLTNPEGFDFDLDKIFTEVDAETTKRYLS